jgi:hypothetical protein
MLSSLSATTSAKATFRKSTLLRLLNRKRYDAAARQFDVWVRGGGKKLPGLVRRRAEEAALFKSGDDPDDEPPIAPSTKIETIEPKSPMNSKTVAGAGVAVAAGGGAVVDQVSDMAEKQSSLLDTLLSMRGLVRTARPSSTATFRSRTFPASPAWPC